MAVSGCNLPPEGNFCIQDIVRTKLSDLMMCFLWQPSSTFSLTCMQAERTIKYSQLRSRMLAAGNQAAREALQGTRSRPGRPPHSPQSIDLKENERLMLTQKSASLGGYLNQEEVRALLENPLLNALPALAPKQITGLKEAAGATQRQDAEW